MIDKCIKSSLIVAAFAMAACSETSVDADGLVALTVGCPQISPSVETRSMPVDGSTFSWVSRTYSPKTGSYCYESYPLAFWICNKDTYNPHLEGYDNFEVLYRPYDAGFSQWVIRNTTYPSPTVSFAIRLGGGLDIYAYYPYVAGVDNPEAVPFTTYEQHDWMWADPKHIDTVQEGSTDNVFTPTFHHAMTCIEVRLSTLYRGTVKLSSITLTDAKSQLASVGTMDIRNGKLTYVADQPSITITGNNADNIIPLAGEDTRSYCFLMPEKPFEAGDLTLTFSFDAAQTPGRASLTLPSHFIDASGNLIDVNTLETGKKYVLNLVVDNALTIRPVNFLKEDWTTVDVDLII